MGDPRQLKDFSIEELEAEIQQRNLIKPQLLTDIDWHDVVEYMESVVERLANQEHLPKDYEHYLFEAVLETMYGPDVWKWWNRHF